MDGYRVFTWNEKGFGAPGAIIKEIAEDGFKVVCIIDPGVKLDPGYAKYDEGIANDYLQKHRKGKYTSMKYGRAKRYNPDFWKAGLDKKMVGRKSEILSGSWCARNME